MNLHMKVQLNLINHYKLKENALSKLKEMIYKSILESIILVIPSMVISWIALAIIISHIQGDNALAYGYTSTLSNIVGDILSPALPPLICSTPIMVKYRSLQSVLPKDKVYKVMLLYYLILQLIYIIIMPQTNLF